MGPRGGDQAQQQTAAERQACGVGRRPQFAAMRDGRADDHRRRGGLAEDDGLTDGEVLGDCEGLWLLEGDSEGLTLLDSTASTLLLSMLLLPMAM